MAFTPTSRNQGVQQFSSRDGHSDGLCHGINRNPVPDEKALTREEWKRSSANYALRRE